MIFFVFSELKTVLKSYKQKSLNLSYHLAGVSLIEFMSFRLPDSAKADKYLAWRALKNVFLRIFILENQIVDYKNNSGIAIIDNSFNYIDLRNSYVENLVGRKIEVHLCKDSLFFTNNIFEKIKLFISSFWIFIKYFKTFSFKNNFRVNYVLLIREIPEIINLLNTLKSKNIDTIVDFANYEVDSNFLYLLLKKNNIHMYKVPSPGPLYIHNKILITDVLVVSSGYHTEELNILKETLIYEKTVKYMPEMSPLFIKHYQDNSINLLINEADKNTIGFYSHASWLRALSNHADNGMNLLEAENNLLEMIKEVITKKPEYKLIIFLHPRERAESVFNKTTAFYNSILGYGNYTFSSPEIKSTEAFNKCNIALVALSTILFERLMMGFKTLIYNDKKNEFPHPSSVLNNISFRNATELSDLLESNLLKENADFFNESKLDSYLLKNFVTI